MGALPPSTATWPARLTPFYWLLLLLLPACAVLEEFMPVSFSESYVFASLAFFGTLVFLTVGYIRHKPADSRGGGPGPAQAASLQLLTLWLLYFCVLQEMLYHLLLGWKRLGWQPLLPHANQDGVWYTLFVGLAVILVLVAPRLPGARFDFNLRPRFTAWDLGIALGLGALTFLGLWLYTQNIPKEVGSMAVFGAVRGQVPDWLYWTAGAAFTVINAFGEELWFRGLLMGLLRNLIRPWQMILLQGLTFGIIHWFGTPSGWWGIGLAGSWGCVLGWWTWKRGSLWPALLVHCLADGLIFMYTNR